MVEFSQGWKFSFAPSLMRYSLYFWFMKSNMASAVGNFTDWAVSLSLSWGMPALIIVFVIFS